MPEYWVYLVNFVKHGTMSIILSQSSRDSEYCLEWDEDIGTVAVGL